MSRLISILLAVLFIWSCVLVWAGFELVGQNREIRAAIAKLEKSHSEGQRLLNELAAGEVEKIVAARILRDDSKNSYRYREVVNLYIGDQLAKLGAVSGWDSYRCARILQAAEAAR